MLNETLEIQRDEIAMLKGRVAGLTERNTVLIAILKDARDRMIGGSPAIVALRNRVDAELAKAAHS